MARCHHILGSQHRHRTVNTTVRHSTANTTVRHSTATTTVRHSTATTVHYCGYHRQLADFLSTADTTDHWRTF